jgi:hypothetical protein
MVSVAHHAEHPDHGTEQRRAQGDARPPVAALAGHAGAEADGDRRPPPHRRDQCRRSVRTPGGGQPTRPPGGEDHPGDDAGSGDRQAAGEHRPVGVGADVDVDAPPETDREEARGTDGDGRRRRDRHGHRHEMGAHRGAHQVVAGHADGTQHERVLGDEADRAAQREKDGEGATVDAAEQEVHTAPLAPRVGRAAAPSRER